MSLGNTRFTHLPLDNSIIILVPLGDNYQFMPRGIIPYHMTIGNAFII